MARRTHNRIQTRRLHGGDSPPVDLAHARLQQLQAKWRTLTAAELRRELRRIVGELHLYGFCNRAGPLEKSLPYLELAALSAIEND